MEDYSYVENKDRSDLRQEFSLYFGSQNVLVFVWNSLRGLERNTNFDGHYTGAYVSYPARKSVGLFGEIHLVKNQIDRGYIAHEVQHFMYDWMNNQKDQKDLNERAAILSGEITNELWSNLR